MAKAIMTNKHQKHAKLIRPISGLYAKQEIGLLGAPCGLIENIVNSIKSTLGDEVKSVYLDADHGEGSEQAPSAQLVDMISHHEYRFDEKLNAFDQKLLCQQNDLAFVNANHFDATNQIPIICLSKRDSLKRKLDRLTNIIAIVLDDGIDAPFDFILKKLEGKEVPIFQIGSINDISSFIRSKISIPPINGLVLAGGKSIRMGEDKSQIKYHGMPQEIFMSEQLRSITSQTFISKADKIESDHGIPIIADSFLGLGPYGAILSAFKYNPNAAWLVVACDQPLLREEHLSVLIKNRNSAKMATCYYNPETNFPEPLITLWEPKAYPRLLSFLSMGYSCPRKVLINSDIQIIEVEDDSFMKNVNTPEQKATIWQKPTA